MKPGLLYYVEAGNFSAALVIWNDVCVDSAPIIKWMRGKSLRLVLQPYCKRKGWHIGPTPATAAQMHKT